MTDVDAWLRLTDAVEKFMARAEDLRLARITGIADPVPEAAYDKAIADLRTLLGGDNVALRRLVAFTTAVTAVCKWVDVKDPMRVTASRVAARFAGGPSVDSDDLEV